MRLWPFRKQQHSFLKLSNSSFTRHRSAFRILDYQKSKPQAPGETRGWDVAPFQGVGRWVCSPGETLGLGFGHFFAVF